MQTTYDLAAFVSPDATNPALKSPIDTPRNFRTTAIWLLAGGYLAAALDTLVAMVWWAPRGIAPSHILQGYTSWFIGPVAFSAGLSAALIGALIYAQLMSGLMAVYYVCARRLAFLWEHPLLCGGVYGALAYFVIFQVIVPILTGAYPKAHDISWIATCVVTYMIFVGMPCALFSRAADRANR